MEPIDTTKYTRYYEGMHHPRFRRYRYYDTKDGENLFKKLAYTTSTATAISYGPCFFHNVIQLPQPASHVTKFLATMRSVLPITLSAAAYTIVTYLATKFRHEDDIYNAMIGGTAAGLTYSSWVRNPVLGIFGTPIVALACAWKKHLADKEGYRFPEIEFSREVEGTWALRNLDFTMAEEIEGDWSRIPRPKPKKPEPPPPPPPPPPQGICAGY